MFENISYFFKRMIKPEQKELGSKDAAKERLHLVLMQDRANVSADFLELMKQELIDVIKKYIVVDEETIDVRLTNQANDDGTNGAPSLFANIPIVNIKNDMMAQKVKEFEGVDFNKEMGIPTYITEENDGEVIKIVISEEGNVEEELKTPEVIELPENIEETSTEKEEADTEENEPTEMFEEIDDVDLDDDDDVTFDDLLKAAEEAEAKVIDNTEEKEVAEEIVEEVSEAEDKIEDVEKVEEKDIEEKKEDKEEKPKKTTKTGTKSTTKKSTKSTTKSASSKGKTTKTKQKSKK